MNTFLTDDFLLDTEMGKALYHAYAAKMPIADYHCHIDPKDIWEDRRFENITQIWLRGRPLQVAAHALQRRGGEVHHRRRLRL